MRSIRRIASLWLALLLCACRAGGAADLPDAPASPQASAEPAPLVIANGAPTTHADAGPPPKPLRGDEEIATDTMPKETARDPLRDASRDASVASAPRDTKELFSGYTLEAVLHVSDLPGPPKAPEVSASGVEAARKKTEARLTIDLSQTRARITFASGAFVLPDGTELRARADRYGDLVIWPGESTYRVAAPGALRALIGERRFDVAPLAPGEVSPSGPGATRVGNPTRKREVATRAAKATFELATLKDAGEGGALVCRALLDLMNADPSTHACDTDQVPLFAELRWTTRGAITFEVQSIARRVDLTASMLAAPPATLSFAPYPPPSIGSEILLSRESLAAFRTSAIDAPPPTSADAQAPRDNTGATALVLVNSSDEMRVATLDGVPVAWIAPGARASVEGLLRGHYVLQWRTFLGDAFEPPQTITVPTTSELGAVDGGAP